MNKLYRFEVPEGARQMANLWISAPAADVAHAVMRMRVPAADQERVVGPHDMTASSLARDPMNLAEVLRGGVTGVMVKQMPVTSPTAMVAAMFAGHQPQLSGAARAGWKLTPIETQKIDIAMEMRP